MSTRTYYAEIRKVDGTVYTGWIPQFKLFAADQDKIDLVSKLRKDLSDIVLELKKGGLPIPTEPIRPEQGYLEPIEIEI